MFFGAVIHSSVPSVRLRFFVLCVLFALFVPFEPASPDALVRLALFRGFVPAFVPALLGAFVVVPASPGGTPLGVELIPPVAPVGSVVLAVRAHADASMATRSAAMPREPYALTEPSDMPRVSATWASVMSAK